MGVRQRRHKPGTTTILTFQHPQLISEYYATRHAVDDNNNLRQGSLRLEDGLAVRSWHIRQFFALMAISEVNALCFYTHNRARQGVVTMHLHSPWSSSAVNLLHN